MTTRESIYKSVLRSIIFKKNSGFRKVRERIEERYGKYIEENQCPLCGKRFRSRMGLWVHLIESGHLELIINNLVNHGHYLIWDYKNGDVIDPLTGEVVSRIYVPR